MAEEFEVYLRFCTTDTKQQDDFLLHVPELCPKREIEMTIQETKIRAPNNLYVRVTVVPPTAEGITDAEMQRLGIKDPARTRAFTALLLWVSSLQRIGEGPLQAAWNHWSPIKDTCPYMLVDHSIQWQPASKLD